MTATEARRLAAKEGLTLVESKVSKSKFMNVYVDPSKRTKPFFAQPSLNGRPTSLGYFATAEEAALAVARHLAAQGLEQEEEAAAAPAAAKAVVVRDDDSDDEAEAVAAAMAAVEAEGGAPKATAAAAVAAAAAAQRAPSQA